MSRSYEKISKGKEGKRARKPLTLIRFDSEENNNNHNDHNDHHKHNNNMTTTITHYEKHYVSFNLTIYYKERSKLRGFEIQSYLHTVGHHKR